VADQLWLRTCIREEWLREGLGGGVESCIYPALAIITVSLTSLRASRRRFQRLI